MNEVNEMGRKVEVNANNYTCGGLPKPHSFKATVGPRSQLHKDVITWEWNKMEYRLRTWDGNKGRGTA